MRNLAEALRFLSIIPVPGKPPKSLSAVLAVYPWAGFILGIIAAAAAWAAGWVFSASGIAVITVAFRIAITGGLHMDGLADLSDGLGGGRDRKKRLAIMADSRLGTFGALALIVLVSLQITVLAELLSISVFDKTTEIPGNQIPLQALFPLIFAPALSRGIIPLMMSIFPSARPGGMGDRNRSSASPIAVLTALISVVIIAVFFYGIAGLIITAALTLFLLGFSAGIARRLGGLTGDVYGALIEIADLLVLFGILLVYRFDLSTPGLLNIIT